MNTIELLTGPARDIFLPGVLAGVAIALQCAVLSVFIVLKRLAFLGQGITHAAFGGVGVAAILGLAAGPGFLIVAGFCILAALLIGAGGDRTKLSADTVIGVVLVGAMALGALLLHIRLRTAGPSPMAMGWESLLFGSIIAVEPLDAVIAWIVGAVVLGAMLLSRRSMLFWAFDAPAARSFGVASDSMRMLLLALTAMTIVVSMKLAGVVLVTALLVIPGAAALLLSSTLRTVMALSMATALAGVLGGLALSFETDLPAGPSIVAALATLLGVSGVISGLAKRKIRRAEP